MARDEAARNSSPEPPAGAAAASVAVAGASTDAAKTASHDAGTTPNGRETRNDGSISLRQSGSGPPSGRRSGPRRPR